MAPRSEALQEGGSLFLDARASALPYGRGLRFGPGTEPSTGGANRGAFRPVTNCPFPQSNAQLVPANECGSTNRE